MTFEKHLFISYAHIDNQPLTPGQEGWISRFHASLEAMLSMRLGRKAEIWRDLKLSGNDIFADEIVKQFPKTAILVSVLTPRYVESDWCTREVHEFCRAAENSRSLTLENKARIIKIIKTPVNSEGRLPALMARMLGYEFYTFVDDAPLELDSAFGPELAQKYNLKLAKLAWDIAQLLKELETVVPGGNGFAPPAPPKPAVYLAECSYDRREIREALEADLHLHGYKVLPARQLSREESHYVGEVRGLLEECKLSVHLVGSGYGSVPDGPSQKSGVVWQNELAIQRSKNAGLKRLIWLPEGTTSQHAEQQRFIEALQQDAEAQFGADLIVGDLETLKGAIHASLRRIETPEPPRAAPGMGRGGKLIYLICDPKDRPATLPIRKFLKGLGCEVKIPVFEGDAKAVRQWNQDLLTRCDAVLLFYGAGDEAWKATLESELEKMKVHREDKPLLASYTYLAEPATDDKLDLIELEEANLIDATGGFSETKMKPFLTALSLT
jgi:hypothetical protein